MSDPMTRTPMGTWASTGDATPTQVAEFQSWLGRHPEAWRDEVNVAGLTWTWTPVVVREFVVAGPDPLSEAEIAALHALRESLDGCTHFDKGYGPYRQCEDPGESIEQRYLARLLATLDATRPSGDEALRKAARRVVDVAIEYEAEDKFGVYPLDLFRAAGELQAALAAPSSTPDVENKP